MLYSCTHVVTVSVKCFSEREPVRLPRLAYMMMLIQVIKDYQLMAVVCILVLVDVLVLTVWEFVDPLVIEVSNKTLEVLVSFSRSFLPAKC